MKETNIKYVIDSLQRINSLLQELDNGKQLTSDDASCLLDCFQHIKNTNGLIDAAEQEAHISLPELRQSAETIIEMAKLFSSLYNRLSEKISPDVFQSLFDKQTTSAALYYFDASFLYIVIYRIDIIARSIIVDVNNISSLK